MSEWHDFCARTKKEKTKRKDGWSEQKRLEQICINEKENAEVGNDSSVQDDNQITYERKWKKKKEAKEMIAQCHKQTESIGNEKSG